MANVARRMARVNQLLREEIATFLQEHYSQDALGFLTVVGASVSTDLKSATVFVSVMGDTAKQEAALAALNESASEIRRGIRKFLSFKIIPNLVFKIDHTAERAERIERLLRGASAPARSARDEPGGGSDGGGDL